MISLKLMRELEAGRQVAEDQGDGATAPTGEPYITLRGLGWADDARKAFADYAKDKTGKLYWRSLPELNEGRDGAGFFMRLLISNG